ncbi:MAG TPA: ABC transporter ATP-binding protein [bacterium]|nr:ABC transporter ATP-binding protein [bacterium]
MPTLETVGLSKIFRKRGGEHVEALRDINLRVETGEFVSIVGASGCGKTTFLRIVDGLLEPSAGKVLLDGREVTKPGPDRGFVFQSDSLFPWRTAEDNVVFGLEVQRKNRSLVRQLAHRFIKMVGLEGFAGHYPYELSGGMRQRVNIARAMTIDPEVLLMDEPFAALDAQTREIMQYELLSIWSQQQKTVLFITHQISEAVFLSDKVVVLTARPGRLKEVIPIKIPRPRNLDVKHTKEFVDYEYQIWKMIEEEVRIGMRLEQALEKN